MTWRDPETGEPWDGQTVLTGGEPPAMQGAKDVTPGALPAPDRRYPVLVPSASYYRIGDFDGYWYGRVMKLRSHEDKEGVTVKVCGHRHPLARTATACAERSAGAIIRQNVKRRAGQERRQAGGSHVL